MERNKNAQKNNKSMPVIIGIVAVIAIIVIVLIVKGGKKNSEVTANLNEAQWMGVNQTLRLIDGSNKITFKVKADQELVKVDGDYEYEVSYVLTVNDEEYTGTHKFGNGYSVHNENNGIPYNIDLIDFEDNKVQVSFSVAPKAE